MADWEVIQEEIVLRKDADNSDKKYRHDIKKKCAEGETKRNNDKVTNDEIGCSDINETSAVNFPDSEELKIFPIMLVIVVLLLIAVILILTKRELIFWSPTTIVGIGAPRPPGPHKIETHLIGQWYWPSTHKRTAEIVKALAKNTNNTSIYRIHFLQPGHHQSVLKTRKQQKEYFSALLDYDAYFPIETLHTKLNIAFTSLHPPGSRLHASDAFAYASDNIEQERGNAWLTRVAILANQDIYFDESLALLETSPDASDLSHYTAYFLSRHEIPENEETSRIGTQCGPKFIGSHDAFVFVPPLPFPLIEKCKFELGSWGIEARLLWEFEQFGMTGRNPCEDIKIWHVHSDGPVNNDDESVDEFIHKRIKMQFPGSSQMPVVGEKRPMPEVNTGGRSSIAFPEGLKPRYK
ncbi:hypothetical protein HK100_006937 [Physocladia obscura]|uniref:Uncharacterized protein n=1 Tax=Physocladia obscura TaxID=109957 RepID=A0AAD5T608_9FUNG|nr:hypothetical protein HK100_006937 [Physocladia obscura]